MKRLFGLALAVMLSFGVFSVPAGAGGDIVKVWTQNLYLGADLTPGLEAKTEEEFYDAAKKALEQMGANLFPLRAQRLATEVAFNRPDLIALQEVEDISLNGKYPGPPFVDYLQTLLDALALRGQHYEVAATVINFDLTIPIDVNGDNVPEWLNAIDRGVILIRKGVQFNILDFGCANSSGDGCNYSFFASVPSPVPLSDLQTIDIKRGFVGIDATVRGKRVFFVNTHLEQRELVPGRPKTGAFQSGQAKELVKLMDTLPSNIPLILTGDFNSSPEDIPFRADSLPKIIPPYKIIIRSGFKDAWKKNPLALFDPEGLTCCQDADLANRRSDLHERIDIVFIRGSRFRPWAFVTTRVPILPLWLARNWASDHGGVFAKLIFK